MRRRDFLAAGLATAGAFALRPLFARARALRRGAVVIGIDQAGTLTKLRAARSGAHQVADWLEQQGFTVTRLIDDTAPIVGSQVYAAVNAFAGSPAAPDQLVIYFAGHGCALNYSEFWLLSNAPANPSETVNVVEAISQARLSPIRNVMFISDACRSSADSLGVTRLNGYQIFPNPSPGPRPITPDIDEFYATQVGDPSWEVPLGDSTKAYVGVYTQCLMGAYGHPYASMVRSVEGNDVVPNRALKAYLAAEVPKLAQSANITINQRPDTRVTSDDAIYISRVLSSTRTAPVPAGSVTPTVTDVAAAVISRGAPGPAGRTGGPPSRFSDQQIDAASAAIGFDKAQNAIAQTRGLPARAPARSGFVVSGMPVTAATANPRHQAAVRVGEGPQASIIDITLKGPAASVAIRFPDGSGAVLAAIDGFIGNVVVDKGGVANVSYVPTANSPMRSEYDHDRDRLADLHAAVAAAARFGSFRVEGTGAARNSAAAQFADRIRILKGVDPTLGVYAAYAYSDAGLVNQVQSVRNAVHDNLGGVDLFDVAMLSGGLAGKPIDATATFFPCCPMLSQGWNYVRVKNVALPQALDRAQDHLRQSLWTTFAPDGFKIVEDVIQQGRWA